jgi:UPF0755 protein
MKKYSAIGILLAAAIGAFVFQDKIKMYWFGRVTTLNTSTVNILVPADATIESLATKLVTLKVIDDKATFLKVASMKKLKGNRLAKGKFKVEASTSYRTLCNGFTINSNGNGNAEVEVNVTFNNCIDLEDIGGKVASDLDIDSAAFYAYITDPSTLEKYDFTLEQIPSLFLPNTYKMFYDTDIPTFVSRMAKEFKAFWTPSRLEKMKKVGLNSPSEVTTIASITYQEQNRKSEEWPLIAGLYLERVKKGMRLQSDPTFRFCWPDKLKGVERLTDEHKAKDCAYNTYLHDGLPPGPICVPPPAVLDAVLNAEMKGYLFMCAKPDYSGLHDFAVGYPEHDANAKIFQKWLGAELRKRN